MGTARKGSKGGLGEEVSAVFPMLLHRSKPGVYLVPGLPFCRGVSCTRTPVVSVCSIMKPSSEMNFYKFVMFSGFSSCELKKCFLPSLLAMENNILIPL